MFAKIIRRPLPLLSNLHHFKFSTSTRRLNDSQNDSKNDLPWYLRPEESSNLSSPMRNAEIPEVPSDSPRTVKILVDFVANELSAEKILVFDLRNEDTEANINDFNANFMIIGTGKSAKHLQKASTKLNFFIKHELNQLPITEGVLKNGDLIKYYRKLQKKGKKAPGYSKNDYGSSPNTWIMTDCKTDGIFVHLLTEERRSDLNLEYLWSNKIDKIKYSKENVGNKANSNDDIFKGIRYFHTSRTLKNELSSFNPFELNLNNYSKEFSRLCELHLSDCKKTPLSKLENHLDLMQASGLQVSINELITFFKLLLQSKEFHTDKITGAVLASDVTVFKKRFSKIAWLLNRFNPILKSEDILKVLPVFLISGSQFENENFLTLKGIFADNSLTNDIEVKYSTVIHKLDYFSGLVLREKNRKNDEEQSIINLLLISIYANRLNWNYFNKILKKAMEENDLVTLKYSIPLIAAKGSKITCHNFSENYLPLILNSEDIEDELKPFIKQVLSKSS